MSEQRTDVVTQVIGGMEDLTKILWSAAALLAPWLVPLAPAAFFGWVMYQTATEAAMPKELAMVVGFVAALGLEAVNIAAAHAAVQLSHNREDHRWKFGLAIGLIIFYVIIGITSMLLLNADWNVKIVGAAMFLLAPVAITAQALTMDLVWTREDAEAEEAKEAERQRWLDEQDYKIKRLRIEQNALVRIERERVKYIEHTEIVREQSAERSAEYDGRLAIIQERTANDPFSPADVRDWLGMSRTTIYEVLKYGQMRGVVRQVGHGQYRMNGKD